MKRMYTASIILAAGIFISCSGSSAPDFTGNDGSGAPVGSIVAPSGSVMSPATVFVVAYSEAMSETDLTIGGSIADEAHQASWDDSRRELRISPATQWSMRDQSLKVTARGEDGNFVTVTGLYTMSTDVTAPAIVSVTPDGRTASAPLGHTTSIRIIFSESMSTNFVLPKGTLGEAGAPVWSATVSANDTVTIGPKTIWNAGTGKTITASFSDASGVPMATDFSGTYDVLSGAVYVNGATGNDANPGTAEQPVKSLQQGIDRASDLYQSSEVRVAQGTYTVDNATSAPGIILKSGVKLKGGYSAVDWGTRDAAAYTTVIDDASKSSNRTIRFLEGDQDAGLDGITVNSAIAAGSRAVYMYQNANPTIHDCRVNYRVGSSYDYAIECVSTVNLAITGSRVTDGDINLIQSAFIFEKNRMERIHTDTSRGGIRCNIFEIFRLSSDVLGAYASSGISFENNLVYFDIGSDNTVIMVCYNVDDAFYSADSRVIIRNNTIYNKSVGHSIRAITILSREKQDVIIENNILYGSGTSGSAISLNKDLFDPPIPLSVKNNCIRGWNSAFVDLAGKLYSVNELNTLYSTNSNTADDPIFEDPAGSDLRLQNVVGNETARTGGLDGAALGWGFTTDYSGAPRTGNGSTGWSMGAYEKD